MRTARTIGISRHRIGTDGPGIRTLVCFHGCPLSCKYCLNPSCLDASSEKVQIRTSEEIIKILRKDALYFLATKGGVTFGGGEPLLYAEFIKEVIENSSVTHDVTLETSLNVPRWKIDVLLPHIQEFIVDIKDMNPDIYKAYTGVDNTQVKDNIRWLIKKGYGDRIICRIPLIPQYNDDSARENSIRELEQMDISRFNKFNYVIRERV